jgi:putative spermidine/putrescine transport system substrate-binding protein
MATSRFLAATATVLVVIGLAACAPPAKEDAGNQTQSGVNAREATSAADFGGMDKLVEAAKAEGALNVIALPPDWANYKEIIDTFSTKYGIKVNSAQPDANSQDEISAANQQKGKSTAPDVFDLGQAIALASTAMFAPYTVSTFDDIPAQFKGSERYLGQRLRGVRVHRRRLVQGPRPHRRQRPAAARVQGQGRPQR